MAGRQGNMRFGWAVPSAARPTTRRRHPRETTIACPTELTRTTAPIIPVPTELTWITALIIPVPTELTWSTAPIIPVPTARIIPDRGALMWITVLPSMRKLTTVLIIPVRAPQLLSALHRRLPVQHRRRIQLRNVPLHSTTLMAAAAPSPLTLSDMRSRRTNTPRRLSMQRTYLLS